MGRKQKTTNNLVKSISLPTERQKIAKVLNGRGKNLFEIQFSDGNITLCTLPPKFRNLIWVKRGSYVIINPISETERANKIGGEIEHVLFPEHVKHLKSEGIWPQEFEIHEENDKIIKLRNEDTSNSDDLFVNTNRHGIDYDTSSSENDDEKMVEK
ncbi:hypothetical protein C1645_731185 [Glomus cerebriforme]|uniref:S1-like domain-containing protein n=1 Tax=Glomus cerebriforme TaxID=658196 RepID=A0A397TPY1_9GLOM|nr:hypothetical protein C1645_731185 [Glomus cerebriforme]